MSSSAARSPGAPSAGVSGAPAQSRVVVLALLQEVYSVVAALLRHNPGARIALPVLAPPPLAEASATSKSVSASLFAADSAPNSTAAEPDAVSEPLRVRAPTPVISLSPSSDQVASPALPDASSPPSPSSPARDASGTPISPTVLHGFSLAIATTTAADAVGASSSLATASSITFSAGVATPTAPFPDEVPVDPAFLHRAAHGFIRCVGSKPTQAASVPIAPSTALVPNARGASPGATDALRSCAATLFNAFGPLTAATDSLCCGGDSIYAGSHAGTTSPIVGLASSSRPTFPISAISPTSSTASAAAATHAAPLILGFEELARRLAALSSDEELRTTVPLLFLLSPFLHVIQIRDSMPKATLAALAALRVMLDYGLLLPAPATAPLNFAYLFAQALLRCPVPDPPDDLFALMRALAQTSEGAPLAIEYILNVIASAKMSTLPQGSAPMQGSTISFSATNASLSFGSEFPATSSATFDTDATAGLSSSNNSTQSSFNMVANQTSPLTFHQVSLYSSASGNTTVASSLIASANLLLLSMIRTAPKSVLFEIFQKLMPWLSYRETSEASQHAASINAVSNLTAANLTSGNTGGLILVVPELGNYMLALTLSLVPPLLTGLRSLRSTDSTGAEDIALLLPNQDKSMPHESQRLLCRLLHRRVLHCVLWILYCGPQIAVLPAWRALYMLWTLLQYVMLPQLPLVFRAAIGPDIADAFRTAPLISLPVSHSTIQKEHARQKQLEKNLLSSVKQAKANASANASASLFNNSAPKSNNVSRSPSPGPSGRGMHEIIGSEGWIIREARLMLLLAMSSTDGFFQKLFATFDCVAGQDDLFYQFVSYHCYLLDKAPAFAHHAFSVLSRLFVSLERLSNCQSTSLRDKHAHKMLYCKWLELCRTSLKQAHEWLWKKEVGLLSDVSATGVAKFLMSMPTIDKKAVGEFISRASAANLANDYMAQFDFAGMRLDAALRIMSAKFRLPSETQQIDRVIESFAKRYYEQNCDTPGFEIADQDAAFVLAFAIMLLNTDQHHHANQQNRMTFEAFSNRLVGLNKKGDFEQNYLRKIYDSIRTNEILGTPTLDALFKETFEQCNGTILKEQESQVDGELMLLSVHDKLVEGMLMSKDARAVCSLAMLTRIHQKRDSLLFRMANINNLVLALPGSNARLMPVLELPEFLAKIVNLNHLVLFFSAMYQHRNNLSNTMRELLQGALCVLFYHGLIPEGLADFVPLGSPHENPVKIPLLPVSFRLDLKLAAVGCTNFLSLADAQSIVDPHRQLASPPTSPPPAPANSSNFAANSGANVHGQSVASTGSGGRSIMNFFSYISTSLSVPDTCEVERKAVQRILDVCLIDKLIVEAQSISSVLLFAVQYPIFSSFALEWATRILDSAAPGTFSEQDVSLYASFLEAMMQDAPSIMSPSQQPDSSESSQLLANPAAQVPLPPAATAHALSSLLRLLPKYPRELQRPGEHAARSSLSTSEAIATLHVDQVAALIPCLPPRQYFAMMHRASRRMELGVLVKLLMSLPSYPRPMNRSEVKAVIDLTEAAIGSSTDVNAVTELVEVYLNVMHSRAIVTQMYAPYLRLLGVIFFHTLIPQFASTGTMVFLDRALSKSIEDYKQTPESLGMLILPVYEHVFAPLLRQLRRLGRNTAETRARVCAMMVKLLLRHMTKMAPEAVETAWNFVLDATLEEVSGHASGYLAETLSSSLAGAICTLYAEGLAKNDPPNALWTETWNRVDKVIPKLHEQLFPPPKQQQTKPTPNTTETTSTSKEAQDNAQADQQSTSATPQSTSPASQSASPAKEEARPSPASGKQQRQLQAVSPTPSVSSAAVIFDL